jgi:PEGA domain
MQAPRRRVRVFVFLAAIATIAAFPLQARAEHLTITSVPPGATIEIDGAPIGITPHTIDYPSSYFHKPHTVFSSRLEHAVILKIRLEGYTTQQVTLTEGPLQWISVTGKNHGKYFLLKADHFDFRLEQISEAKSAAPGPGSAPGGNGETAGERNRGVVKASLDTPRGETSTVTFTSDPSGAEIYIDGRFMGQTPSTITMLPGSHAIVLKAAGRKNWQRELDVLKNSQVALNPILEAQQ